MAGGALRGKPFAASRWPPDELAQTPRQILAVAARAIAFSYTTAAAATSSSAVPVLSKS